AVVAGAVVVGAVAGVGRGEPLQAAINARATSPRTNRFMSDGLPRSRQREGSR
ncbi:MAG: hypothetical protein QOH79_1749, partial [Acidimicrobiaceae bacterium]